MQTYQELEIIVIDDGSDDDKSTCYRTICNIDGRIKYQKMHNGGVSKARNFGIDIANGNYLAFVDSDDMIQEDFIESALTRGMAQNSDIVVGLIKYVGDDKGNRNKPLQVIPKETNISDKSTMVKCFYSIEYAESDFHVLASPCGRLYKTTIAKKIKFREDTRFWEDQLYNREFIAYSDIITLVPEEWYYYYQNNYSSMHKRNNKWIDVFDWVGFCEHWITLNDRETQTDIKKTYSKMIITFINQTIQVGIISGLKPDIKFFKNVFNNLSFQSFFSSIEREDFLTKQRYFQFLLMKYQMIRTLFLLAKIKNILIVFWDKINE